MKLPRTWLQRGAFVAAVIASIATSRASWMITADLPVGATVRTPVGGSEAVRVAIEASSNGHLSVSCVVGDRVFEVQPLGEIKEGRATTYLCPPGGAVDRIVMYGDAHGGGACSKPEPPDDAYLRVARADVVQTWETTADASFDVEASVDDPRYVSVQLSIPVEDVSIAAAATLDGRPASAYESSHHKLSVSASASDPDAGSGSRLRGKLAVHATIRGVCAPSTAPCAAPPAGSVHIERVK